MTLEFVISGRIKILNRPFGTDLIYHFHRQIGIAAFLMVFSHPISIIHIGRPIFASVEHHYCSLEGKSGGDIYRITDSIVWTAEYRQKIKMSYKHWKILHGIIAAVMVALALCIYYLAGNYVNLPWKQAFGLLILPSL